MLLAFDAVAHGFDAADGTLPGWTLDPWIIVPLIASALLFAIGWVRLRARSKRDAEHWRRQAILFSAGWGVIAASLLSPLHAAGERSFTAHMIEHELLMLLGAPLLVLARPLPSMLWALPSAVRRWTGLLLTRAGIGRLWASTSKPLTATTLQAAALWLWHAPVLFDLALGSNGWHIAQHVSFLGSALLFWSAMLTEPTGRTRASASRAVAALCLFATSVVSGALGGLMAMSQSPWYAGYARLGMAPFELTPAEDQQLAGLLMWIPGGLVHAIVALMLLRGVLVEGDARERRVDAT